MTSEKERPVHSRMRRAACGSVVFLVWMYSVVAAVPILARPDGGGVASGPAGPPSAARVELGKVNILSGSDSGSIAVHLSSDAVVDLRSATTRLRGPNPNIGIRGSGRFVGFALVGQPFTRVRERGRFLLAGRFADCSAPGCEPSEFPINYVNGLAPGRGRVVLESGDYRLFLIADGAPVRIKLTFIEGPSGRALLRPGRTDTIDLQTLATRFWNEQGQTTWWAGSHFNGGQIGFSVSSVFVTADQLNGTELGVCQYNRPGPPPEEIAYGPHCSLLSNAMGSGAEFVLAPYSEDEFILILMLGYHEQGVGLENPDGTRGLGAWFRSPGDVERFGATTFFVRLK